MGIFEMPPFDTGTVELAKAVAESGRRFSRWRRRFRKSHQERRGLRQNHPRLDWGGGSLDFWAVPNYPAWSG